MPGSSLTALLLLTLRLASAQTTACPGAGGQDCGETNKARFLRAKSSSAGGDNISSNTNTPSIPAVITPIIGWWDTCMTVPESVMPTNRNLVVVFKGNADLDHNGKAPAHKTSEVLYFTNAGGGSAGSHISKAFLQGLAVDAGGKASAKAMAIKTDGWDGLSFDLESLSGVASAADALKILSNAFDGIHKAGLNVLVSTSFAGETGQLQATLPPGSTAALQEFLTGMRAMKNIDIWAPQMYATGTPPKCMVPGPTYGNYSFDARHTAPIITQACKAHVPLGPKPDAMKVMEWLKPQKVGSADWKNVGGFMLWGSPTDSPSGCNQ